MRLALRSRRWKAVENNAIPLIVWGIIAAGAYVVGTGGGDPLEGLAVIGSGEDPLSQAMAFGVEQSVTFAMAHYPDETLAVLGVLETLDGAIDATVEYLDDKTNKVVSAHWNDLDPKLQNQLKGGGKVVSVFVPVGSIKALKQLKYAKQTGKIDEAIDGASINEGASSIIARDLLRNELAIQSGIPRSISQVAGSSAEDLATSYRLDGAIVTRGKPMALKF